MPGCILGGMSHRRLGDPHETQVLIVVHVDTARALGAQVSVDALQPALDQRQGGGGARQFEAANV